MRACCEMGFPATAAIEESARAPDVAFVGRKLAIEIRGCFWHRCPVCSLSGAQEEPRLLGG